MATDERVEIRCQIGMRTFRHRATLALTVLIGSAASLMFACVGEDAPFGSTDTSDGGNASPEGGQSQGADLAIELNPAQPESLPNGSVKVHVKVRSSAPVAGNIKVALAPAATDAGASPLTVDNAQLDLPGELPERDVVVSVGASSRHGFFPITLVATATTQSGAPLRTEASLVVRIVGTAGTLDTGYGDGKGSIDFCPFPTDTKCQPGDLYVYPDGRVLVVGSAYQGSSDKFFAARFMPDGTLDTTFGSGGLVSQTIGTLFSYVRSELAPMMDGSFVIAFTGASYLAYAHMSENGVIDTSWGKDGGVDTSLLSGDTTGGRIVPTATGFLLAGSKLVPPDNHDVAVVEAHLADGKLDPTFGSAGTATFQVSSSTTASTLLVDPTANGRIVVGGEDFNGSQTGAKSILVALTSKGAIDTTFGGPMLSACGPNFPQGCTTHDTADTTQDGVKGILKQKNGYIAIAGYNGFSPVKQTIKVFHTSAQGARDSFDTIEVDTGANIPGTPGAFLVQPDDAFLVANGYSSPTFFIARYGADGKLDTAFGTKGIAEPVPGYVRRMALLEGGRELLVIGSEGGNAARLVRIARYWLR